VPICICSIVEVCLVCPFLCPNGGTEERATAIPGFLAERSYVQYCGNFSGLPLFMPEWRNW
jgi:hypothetical protein